MASASDIYVKLQNLSNQATNTTLKYNREEANTARTWQKMMSDTSHQREVKDLISAGLNPVLSSGGQGAQSYTTSSASGQAENAANAVANAYGADKSAAATRYAAQQSAAATRAMAAANIRAASIAAAAQMYHSDKSYAATVYGHDKKLEGVKYQTDHSKSGTPAGILSNIFNAAVNDPQSKTVFSKSLATMQKIRNNADNYLRNPAQKFSRSNMTQAGIVAVNKEIKKCGVENSRYRQELYIDAFLNHDKKAMIKWTNLVKQINSQKNNAARRLINFHGLGA